MSTRRVPWVPSLALGLLALIVLANGYSDLFGDHWGNVWRTVNPLFIGSSSVAAVVLWRSRHTTGQVGAVVSAALGALVFANAYFVNNGVDSGRYLTRCGCLRHWPGPPAPANPTPPQPKVVSHRVDVHLVWAERHDVKIIGRVTVGDFLGWSHRLRLLSRVP